MWILKFDKRSNYEKQGFRNLHCGTKLSHIQAREIIMKLIITSMKSILYSFSNKSNEKTFLQYFPVILKRIFRLTGKPWRYVFTTRHGQWSYQHFQILNHTLECNPPAKGCIWKIYISGTWCLMSSLLNLS